MGSSEPPCGSRVTITASPSSSGSGTAAAPFPLASTSKIDDRHHLAVALHPDLVDAASARRPAAPRPEAPSRRPVLGHRQARARRRAAAACPPAPAACRALAVACPSCDDAVARRRRTTISARRGRPRHRRPNRGSAKARPPARPLGRCAVVASALTTSIRLAFKRGGGLVRRHRARQASRPPRSTAVAPPGTASQPIRWRSNTCASSSGSAPSAYAPTFSATS